MTTYLTFNRESRLLSYYPVLTSFWSLLFLLLTACQTTSNSKIENFLPSEISILGNQFVDNLGRSVILNGINVVSKSKENQYLFEGGPEFYRNLKKWGFNHIRFIIIWDGLEPTPGVYNESYLQEIDKRIGWARASDLFVVLDMHQDLFSVKYADGAPEWATLDEDKEHILGEVWSDSYMMSPAVQLAFDNFWANKKASDGIGLQDHYANLWQKIAERYRDNPTVIGYDIMNEPFPGTSGLQAVAALLGAYGQLLYDLTGESPTEAELLALWGDADGREEALRMLVSEESYARVIDAIYPFNKAFEVDKLQPFYQKVASAIRSVDQENILFLEHSYFGNTGVESSIERTILVDGSADPFVAYAPHGYDLVTDTENASKASAPRVSLIYDRIVAKAKNLGMPVWMGEWGAYYAHGDKIIPTARHSIQLIEKHKMGNAYWSYYSGLEDQSYFREVIIRPYPAYVSGELLDYWYDPARSKFIVSWNEDPNIEAASVIYIPWLSRLSKEKLNLKARIEMIADSDAGFLIVDQDGKRGKRTLELHFDTGL